MRSACFTIIVLVIMVSCAKVQVVLYVAPDGNDNSSGTKEQPLASLVGARNAIRSLKKDSDNKQAFTVFIEDGRYIMQESLLLLPEDSGTEEYPITYSASEGAYPKFSGGKEITGFTVNNEGIWQVQLPKSNQHEWNFDQLYVNGKRATLARTPNEGFMLLDSVREKIWKKGQGRVAERGQQTLYLDSNTFKPLLKIKEEELKNVRFKAYHKWDFTLRQIDALSCDSMSITTSGKGMKPWNKLKKGTRLVVENFSAALDAPGEWFLSDSGILNYMPRAGETIEETNIIAPVLENFITLKGNASAKNYVEHISFKGLSFEYSHYQIPSTGVEPNQAAALLNSAIYAEGSRKSVFSEIEVSYTGQHAIWFGKGCSDNLVEKNYLHHLGGGGIYLGDFEPFKGVEHTKKIQLTDNIIQTGGREFPSAVGIWVGHSSDNIISHNDISDIFYTGISVGWIWGYKPSLAKNNTISFNRIHHIGWDLLSDMAGIYTLGKSSGTVVSNNVVHDIHAYSYGGWGLYADEGSSDIIFENNLVWNTKTGGFQQNYGEANLVENNILAFAKKFQMQCTVAEKHRSFTFKNNIILFTQGMVAKGAWDTVNAKVDDNIYWNLTDNQYDFNSKDFEEWEKLGFDTHSFLEDPEFTDPQSFDFTFKSKKTIEKIGFIPFDYTKAGVLGTEEWRSKAKLPKNVHDRFRRTVAKNSALNIKR